MSNKRTTNRAQLSHGTPFLDLFCGAGGLSLGFREAGFEVIGAYDTNPAAVETHRANIGEHVACKAVDEDLDSSGATVIAGGPPCQGFSSAGQRRSGDCRNTLVSVFAKIIASRRPLAFVFENVEGFLTGENGERVLDLLTPVVDAGYRVHLRKVNAANYGVPQHRKRVIAIGGLGWEPSFPEPSHSASGAPGAHLAGQHLPSTPSLGVALTGLPPPAASAPGVPQGHYHLPLDEDDLARLRLLGAGQTMRDLPEHMWHESYRRRAFRRVMDGTPTERRGGAPCGIRRLRADEPSKAITGGARSEFVHPTADRYLTLRECARIQTFPDDFKFVGTAAEQALLIGNAVPPRLAAAIAGRLAEDLRHAKPEKGRGALLSFVPTLSTGMSPALQNITNMVYAKFSKRMTEKQLSLWHLRD